MSTQARSVWASRDLATERDDTPEVYLWLTRPAVRGARGWCSGKPAGCNEAVSIPYEAWLRVTKIKLDPGESKRLRADIEIMASYVGEAMA